MRWRWLSYGVFIALIVLAASSVAIGQHLFERADGWAVVSTGSVQVYSNAPGERIQRVLIELHRVARFYDSHGVDRPGRLDVVLFADASTFLPFQVASRAPAFYQRGRGRDRIVAYDIGDDLLPVLRHEYFHYWASRQGLQFPKWLEEGLAEVYSTIRMEGPCIRIGDPIQSHLRLLSASSSTQWNLQRLFSVDQPELDAMNPADRQLFYARSWLLVHMFMHSERWQPAGGSFFDALARSSTEDALWEAYGVTPVDLEASLSHYEPGEEGFAIQCGPVNRQTGNNAAFPPKLADADTAKRDPVAEMNLQHSLFGLGFGSGERPLKPWEVPLLQADILGMLGKQEAAGSIYARLAGEFPDVPQIRESQGMLALERRDMEAAQRHFEEAIERSSQSGAVYYQLATLRCGMQSEEAACLEWIDRALSHDDVGREAQLYAIDFALNVRDFPRALRYLENAQPESDEDKVQMLQKIAYAHYQLEQFDEARKAIADAESFEESRRHAKPIADLKRAIAQREQFVVQKRLFEGSPDDPALQEAVRKAFASFESEPNAKLEAGTLREVVCGEGTLALLADTPSGRLRLDVENPMDLTILTGNRRHRELELTCGPQSSTNAQFGYLLTGEGVETRGRLRILRFDIPETSSPQ